MAGLIDTNVYVSRWPERRLYGDTVEELGAELRRQNVEQAWVGSFDGLFQRDIAAVNLRLVEDCRKLGPTALPFGTVNPTLPDWEDDVRRCGEVHRMRGLRLHPNYHGYTLDDPRFARLLELAAERKLVIQLALSMEDERTQSPATRAPHVDPKPLAAIVKQLPGLKLVLINVFRVVRPEKAEALAAAGQVYFDIAMLEGIGGVSKLIEAVSVERIVFGSYFPFFYSDSSVLKLRESPLARFQHEAIALGNARQILG
jgi:hypothetical protein